MAWGGYIRKPTAKAEARANDGRVSRSLSAYTASAVEWMVAAGTAAAAREAVVVAAAATAAVATEGVVAAAAVTVVEEKVEAEEVEEGMAVGATVVEE